MPLAVDEELAVIFREMRRASHLDRAQLCDHLRTPVAVIDALEAGAVGSLPSWPETIRVVNAYTRMLGLDPRPILRRIRSQMDLARPPQPKEVRPAEAGAAPADRAPRAPEPAQKATPPMPPGVAGPIQPSARQAPQRPAQEAEDEAGPVRPTEKPPESGSAPSEAEAAPEAVSATVAAGEAEAAPAEAPARGRGLVGRVATWIFVLAICGGLGYAISHVARNPQVIVDTVAGLPEPIPSAARLIRDMVMTAPGGKAPVSGQDGAPRREKSDRLPQDQAPAIR